MISKALKNALSYSQYRELVNELYASGKVTGVNQSADYLQYTALNIHRMNKWDKHYVVDPEVRHLLTQLEEKEIWLVISEGWCGDAAHILPVINKLAEVSENIELKIVLRDENPELMDAFLTNGSRSIPKLIRLNPAEGTIKGSWGPRPAEAVNLMAGFKAAGKPTESAKDALQLWYGRNRGKNIEAELAGIMAKEIMA